MQEIFRMHAEGTLSGPAALCMRNARPAEDLYDTLADPHQLHNLAGDPSDRPTLERMRRAVAEWMHAISDQGRINEAEMIDQMWPGGVQPMTAAPYIFRRGPSNWQDPARDTLQTLIGPAEIEIYAPTRGASIGYTTDEDPDAAWKLYTGPFRMEGPATIRRRPSATATGRAQRRGRCSGRRSAEGYRSGMFWPVHGSASNQICIL